MSAIYLLQLGVQGSRGLLLLDDQFLKPQHSDLALLGCSDAELHSGEIAEKADNYSLLTREAVRHSTAHHITAHNITAQQYIAQPTSSSMLLCILQRIAANISSAVLPVAHIKNKNPNLRGMGRWVDITII
jgi:hypothetical protein